ncbi:MAG: RnfH family protein [Burkholderiaceae bacterium]|jgi:putative ubiquitin-RnfH superfamily antitoxin RatB of RatAB toxin-antitoxin module|nr:RnfH family protein [Burkholderiaceae bacterium]
MSSIAVTVVCASAARQVVQVALELPAGSTVRDALAAADLPRRCPAFDWAACAVAVWGVKAGPEQPLRMDDRVELLRPLRVDPKLARRERFSRQGARAAGLFAQRRAGGKPGY